MTVRALVITGSGINCEEETAAAFRLAGAEAEVAPPQRAARRQVRRCAGYQVMVFPGGFSFGDDLGAGKALANRVRYRRLPSGRPFFADLQGFLADGGFLLGICNGFQVLVKTGLLPNVGGALPTGGQPHPERLRPLRGPLGPMHYRRPDRHALPRRHRGDRPSGAPRRGTPGDHRPGSAASSDRPRARLPDLLPPRRHACHRIPGPAQRVRPLLRRPHRPHRPSAGTHAPPRGPPLPLQPSRLARCAAAATRGEAKTARAWPSSATSSATSSRQGAEVTPITDPEGWVPVRRALLSITDKTGGGGARPGPGRPRL